MREQTEMKHTGIYLGTWGSVQHQRTYLPGMVEVSTAGHGGVCLSNEREAQIPEYMRQGKAYEEDCDWCIPFIVFADELREKYGDSKLKGWENMTIARMLSEAERTLKSWHWQSYEKFFGRIIPQGESYQKDKETNSLAGVR